MAIIITVSTTKDRNTVEPTPWEAFAAGVVKPIGSLDAGTRNVGPRMGDGDLTPYYGDISLTTNQVLTGLDIHGKVTCSAGTTGAIVRDCVIRGNGGATTQDSCAVGPSYNFRGTVFEWCRFDATGVESLWKDCIDGGNYTVRYSELLRGIDGMGGNLTGNATMEMCRIYHGHYGAWWNDSTGAKRTATFNDWFGNTYTAPFPSHASGDSHADGAQLQGNTGWVIRGCNIGGARSSTSTTNLDPTIQADYNIVNGLDTDVGFSNSAIILNAISANPLGVLIEKNWLEGGTARLNMSIAGSDTCGGVSVLNNRFIRGSGGFYIYAQTGNTATFTGNVFDDDGTPVTITNW